MSGGEPSSIKRTFSCAAGLPFLSWLRGYRGIKGIGPKSRTKLLREFGSLKKIKEASIEDLRKAGLTLTQAQAVKISL